MRTPQTFERWSMDVVHTRHNDCQWYLDGNTSWDRRFDLGVKDQGHIFIICLMNFSVMFNGGCSWLAQWLHIVSSVARTPKRYAHQRETTA